MKILITGKRGQVGFELCRAMSVLGTIHAVDVAQCDLADETAIVRLMQSYRPDVVINPAAYTAVDKAEDEPIIAEKINARAPAIFAQEAEKIAALMVHYSTDYVFDGNNINPYRETDTPNPQNVYGASKLAGEIAVQTQCSRHLIFRTSWVVGAYGNNFAKTVLRLAQEKTSLQIVADQYGAPTSAEMLADMTAHIVRQYGQTPHDFPYGLYHATAEGVTHWHEYACYVVARAREKSTAIRVAENAIHPLRTDQYPTRAKRPKNSRLDTTKLRETFGLVLPPWQESLDRILERILY